MLKINSLNNNYLLKNVVRNSKKEESKQIDKNDDKTMENQLVQLAQLNKMQINFKAKMLPFNNRDLSFFSKIATALGISATSIEKLKEYLSDYLNKNNINSLDELQGDEHFKEQSEIADNFINILHYDSGEDSYKADFLANELIERCDAGEHYIPSETTLEEFMIDELQDEAEDLFDSVKQLKIERAKDTTFCTTIISIFQLDKQEAIKFFNLIQDALKDNELTTLDQFYQYDENGLPDESLLAEVENLKYSIQDELDLSDRDMMLFDEEFSNRMFSSDGVNMLYIPNLHQIDRNNPDIENKELPILRQILSKYSLTPEQKSLLIYAIKSDAYDNKLNSILELFNQKQKYSINSVSYFINKNGLEDTSEDLLIDLYDVGRNASSEINKKEEEKAQQKAHYLNVTAILYLLDANFKFSKKNLKDISNYLEKENFDTKNNMWKVAYEIADHFNLEGGAEEKIVDAIQKVNQLNEDEKESYHMQYLFSMIKK